MTIVIEISKPFQKRPGYIRTNIGRRVWWLYFAIGIYARRHDQMVGGHTEWIN